MAPHVSMVIILFDNRPDVRYSRQMLLDSPSRSTPGKAKVRKFLLVLTDLGLLGYWIMTALGLVSVGGDDLLHAWNWSFLPLDLLAIIAGLVWSRLPTSHVLAQPAYVVALTLTHAAGLMALSFFALWGSWDWSWWVVNLWLAGLPIVLAISGGKPTDAPQVTAAA